MHCAVASWAWPVPVPGTHAPEPNRTLSFSVAEVADVVGAGVAASLASIEPGVGSPASDPIERFLLHAYAMNATKIEKTRTVLA